MMEKNHCVMQPKFFKIYYKVQILWYNQQMKIACKRK